MDGKLTLASYVAFGFFLNSAMHTWYVSKTMGTIRFAIPFSEFGAGLSPTHGYVGSVVLGLSAFWAAWVFTSALPPLHSLDVVDLLPALRTGLIMVVVIVPISQFLAGASWSKVALDGLVLLTGLMVLVSYIRPYSFFEMVGTYVTILGFIITLGAVWISQYVDTLHAGTFPSAAYFGICALYVLLGSAYLIFQNILKSL